MTKTLTVATFDYSQIESKHDRSLLQRLEYEVVKQQKLGNKAAMEIGKAIQSAHNLLSTTGTKGMFAGWIEDRCAYSRSQAYRLKDAYEAFGNCPTVGQFQMRALFELSGPNCPEEATAEAIKLSKDKRITEAIAKEIKAKYAPKPAIEHDEPDTSDPGAREGGADEPCISFPAESKDGAGVAIEQDGEEWSETAEADATETDAAVSLSKAKGNTDTLLRQLTQSLDVYGAAAKSQNGNSHKACLSSLGEFQADWKNWSKA